MDFFNPKRYFASLTCNYFPLLVRSVYLPHREYAVQASSPIFSGDCQALGNVQKLALTFVKGLCHVQYEAALFYLVRCRTRGDLICMYKTMHGLLDFPCDAVFAAPTHSGLHDNTFKIHQQCCKTSNRMFLTHFAWYPTSKFKVSQFFKVAQLSQTLI